MTGYLDFSRVIQISDRSKAQRPLFKASRQQQSEIAAGMKPSV